MHSPALQQGNSFSLPHARVRLRDLATQGKNNFIWTECWSQALKWHKCLEQPCVLTLCQYSQFIIALWLLHANTVCLIHVKDKHRLLTSPGSFFFLIICFTRYLFSVKKKKRKMLNKRRLKIKTSNKKLRLCDISTYVLFFSVGHLLHIFLIWHIWTKQTSKR